MRCQARRKRGRTLHSIHGFPVPYGVPRFLAVKSLFSPIDLFFEVEALPGAGAATVESFYHVDVNVKVGARRASARWMKGQLAIRSSHGRPEKTGAMYLFTLFADHLENVESCDERL